MSLEEEKDLLDKEVKKALAESKKVLALLEDVREARERIEILEKEFKLLKELVRNKN